MTWVRSEYAGELSVLSAWVCAVLPWSISFGSRQGLTVVVVRFYYVMLQFIFGAKIEGERPVLPVWEAPSFTGSQTVANAYWLWAGAAVIITAALVFSVVYYLREAAVETWPVDPVRIMGGLLVAAALVQTASLALLWQGYALLTLPVGTVFCYVLGGLLLLVERA